MRKAIVALALVMLSGCVSLIDSIYDEQARTECDRSRDRSGCYDRVEQNRRERDR